MTPKSDPAPGTLETIPFNTFREELATVLNLVNFREQGFVITRHSKPCAVVLPLSVLEKLGFSLDGSSHYKGKAV